MPKQIVHVEDVMKPNIDFVDGRETVASALEQMEHSASHALIVNKRDEQDEYGIVLLADIAKKVLSRDRAPDRVNIYEIMTKPVISVHAKMDIRYCARMFQQFGLNVAPVTRDGVLVGIVSYNDIVLKGWKQLATAIE